MPASEKQTENKRPDGKFAEGNKLGNRFKPGQSGNPKGRPKSITLSEAYRKLLAQVDESDPDGRTRAEVLAEQMYLKAKTGDVQALREMADRVEGKPRQGLPNKRLHPTAKSAAFIENLPLPQLNARRVNRGVRR